MLTGKHEDNRVADEEQRIVTALSYTAQGSGLSLAVRLEAIRSLAAYLHNGAAVSALTYIVQASGEYEELKIAAARALGRR